MGCPVRLLFSCESVTTDSYLHASQACRRAHMSTIWRSRPPLYCKNGPTHGIYNLTRPLPGRHVHGRVACGSSLMVPTWGGTCNMHCVELILGIARISAFEPSWLRLGQSQAGFPSKLIAIRMAAWPATLHGSSVVHVGARRFEQLRTHATKALRVAGPGLNSKLLLGFVESPMADPEYYALWHSIRDLARLARPDTAITCLSGAARPWTIWCGVDPPVSHWHPLGS